MTKPEMPKTGGRFYREKDGSLTRADKEGKHPSAAVAPPAKPEPAPPFAPPPVKDK